MIKYVIKSVGSCYDVYERLENGVERLRFIGFSEKDYTISSVKSWLISRYSGKRKIKRDQIIVEC